MSLSHTGIPGPGHGIGGCKSGLFLSVAPQIVLVTDRVHEKTPNTAYILVFTPFRRGRGGKRVGEKDAPATGKFRAEVSYGKMEVKEKATGRSTKCLVSSRYRFTGGISTHARARADGDVL